MLKLYKKVDDGIYYWETWDKNKKTGIVHWGLVGTQGQNKEVKSKFFSSHTKQIQQEINNMVAIGYQQIDIDEQYTLVIEFRVNGMGTPYDVAKRNRLQLKMDDTLGWTGLGHCDGGSIGSGTMEVCCFVVDFDIAKAVIIKELENTEFSDYMRIFDENE
ncbi:hypothetical protein [Mucilaginibacter ginsenosidivorax]|uniref:WGR domain-containing protein n=1 Tax=Mucilaginibacter ginsenosidivorax TaxID=862126 RepID=A0A5B8W7P7_9SPHI|nr:hypothetical protein [Mucilaginibacter ginsenosidivorax]QEC79924.1 hypothetical protein FSB76_29670 [Mucilaginibacter ginsenosidivorax]